MSNPIHFGVRHLCFVCLFVWLITPFNTKSINNPVTEYYLTTNIIWWGWVSSEELGRWRRVISVSFVLTTKTTQPHPQVFSVNVSIICNFAALLTSSVQYGKILSDLVDISWLWCILRLLLANQKQRNILNEWYLLFCSGRELWSMRMHTMKMM